LICDSDHRLVRINARVGEATLIAGEVAEVAKPQVNY